MKTILFPMFIESAKGGMQQIVLDLLLGLKDYGYNCIFIGYKDCEISSYYEKHGIESIGIPKPIDKIDFIKFIYLFYKTIHQYKDALIITNDIFSHILLSLYIKSKKEIFVSHGGDYKSKGNIYAARSGYSAKIAKHFSFKRVKKFIAVSDTQETALIENAKVKKEKVQTIYNGYNCKIENPTIRRIEKDQIINISIVGYIKRLKNQHIILNAISKLREDGYNCILNFYGSVSDKEYKNELDLKIKATKLEAHTHFHGYVSNKEEIYLNTDILVSCSHHEGFGLSLIEAIAHRVPVIAYKKAAGPSIIIENNISGILVEENTSEHYYVAIKKLITDKDFHNSVQECAFKKYKEKFSLPVMIEKYKQIIDSIL